MGLQSRLEGDPSRHIWLLSYRHFSRINVTGRHNIRYGSSNKEEIHRGAGSLKPFADSKPMSPQRLLVGFALSVLLALAVGCDDSESSSNGSNVAFGSALYPFGSSGLPGSGAHGGPNAGNVGPGNGEPLNFGPGGDDTPPPPTILPFESFLYLPAISGDAIVTLGQATDGLLSLLVPRTEALNGLESVSKSPDGNFLYALGMQGVSIFSVRDGDGVLSKVGSDVATTNFSQNLVLTPGTPGFAYIANPMTGGNVITGYRREANGSLTPLAGFPVAVSAGTDRFRLSLGNVPNMLYAAISQGGDVQRYRIEPDGSLTELELVSGSAARIWKIAFSATTPYAYATNVEAGSISIFSVDTGGALTLQGSFTLPNAIVTAGSIRPFDIISHPTLPVMYVQATAPAGGVNGAVAVLGIDESTGALSLLDHENPGLGIGSVFLDFTASYLFTTAGADVLFSYTVNADGTLDPLEAFTIDPNEDSFIYGDERGGSTVENTLFRRFPAPDEL